MSNLYNLEPQPTAKVILSTTTGDLTLELFAKQTPLASRNFLQHCLDGYYNGTIFHRLVPEFIIQGGDPTGTGSGGEPAINGGEVFEDEIHTRLKFNRRGLLGMANEGPNSNGSQFFFTLDATPELQGKTTMFGRIEGDTIYNLMKMADAEVVEGSERPMYPTKITGAEILVNPFEDMVRRIREAPRTAAEEKGKGWKKRKKPAGKNVLSFGGEEGEDGEEEVVQVKKKVKANPKLVVVEEEAEVEKAPKEKRPKKKAKEDEPMPDADTEIQEIPNPTPRPDEVPESDQLSEQEESSEDEEDRRQRKLDKTNAEIQALKASMKRTVDLKPAEKQKPQSVLEAMIPETSTRGRKRGKVADEKGAFDLFNSFKKRLDDLPTAEPEEATVSVKKEGTEDAKANDEDGDEEAALCDLHFIANCQSCKSWDDDEGAEVEGDEENDTSWMAKKLTFAKDALGKDLEWKRKMAEIEVIDPREKAREIKEEKRKGKKERR